MEKKSKMRIGIILNSFDVPLWIYLLIQKLKESNHTSLLVIIHNSKSHSEQKNANTTIKKHKGSNWLFNTYVKYEKKRINLISDLTESKNCEKILDELTEKNKAYKIVEFNDSLNITDINQLKEYNLDVIINLSFKKIPKHILGIAKFGIWSYQCMNDIDKIDITGFWETYKNKPVSCTILEMIKEENDKKIIDLSFSFTDPLYFLKNRMNQNWKKTIIIPRKLKKMYESNDESLDECINEYDNVLNFYDHKICFKPTNIQVLNFFVKHIKRYFEIKKKYKHKIEQWCLLFYLKQKDPQIQKGFQKIIPPKDRFYADPFIVGKESSYFVFIEEFVYGQNKGHISYLKINQNGEYSEPKKILERPYHLSYPFVFKFKNDYYMIPETSENKSIELYRCIKFPDEWEFVKTLMNDIVAVDNTILEKDGKWWLFTSTPEMNESSNDVLNLYYSDDLLNGEWVPHPKNPIISDVRKARSAGKLFKIGDKLYRPAQDCSIGYGRGIKLNLIKILSEENYEELTIGSIYAHEDKIEGTHTYSNDGNLTIFDYKILNDV
jgi:hypothetical protein